MTITAQEEERIRKDAERDFRIKYLEQENEELKARVEEMHSMMTSMNENLIALQSTVNSVAKPLNEDIKALKDFSQDFKNTKSRIIGGVIVLSVIVGSLWGVLSPVISKLLSLKFGAS